MSDLDRVTRLRAALWGAGYPPVAVLSAHYPTATGAGKRPQGTAWQDRARLEIPEAARRDASMDALNTGILCDGLRAVDLDVEDPEKIRSLLMFAEAHLGVAPVRHRANSARLLLLYRAAEGKPGKRSVTAPDGQKVEVLGFGQQFVAAGLHPTGAAIKWKPDEKGWPWKDPLPWTGSLPKRDQLKAVTEEQVGFFLEDASRVIGAPPEGQRSSRPLNEQTNARASTPPPLVPLDVLDVIMTALPNGPEFSDRGRWLAMGHAIASAYAEDLDRGRSAWMDWCEKWTGGVPDDEHADRTWDSLGDEHQADVRFILAAARRAGVNLRACGYTPSEVIRVSAEDEFTATEDAPSGDSLPALLGVEPSSVPAGPLQDLEVRRHNMPAVADDVGRLLRTSPRLFERAGGGPVAVYPDPDGLPRVEPLSVESVVYATHQACTPVAADKEGRMRAITLPDQVARIYLAEPRCRQLRPFRGIAATPLLDEVGTIRCPDGYDPPTGMWCHRQPDLDVLEAPGRADAESALLTLRRVLSGFCFADATRITDEFGVARVDLASAPGQDETAALAALLTAVCRPSLPLAPGLIVAAPAVTGAGSGKGLLVRVISSIAFGAAPRAIAPGRDAKETDARINGELLSERPVLFLDNANGRAFSSDLLASAMTEREVGVRALQSSKIFTLAVRAWVALAGNGLHPSEDMVRRVLLAKLDSGLEDAESRPFDPGFLEDVHRRRSELLAAALTIWRWGRLAKNLPRGANIGSFEVWAEWVRDPLMALGCADPVERIRATKAMDPRRARTLEILRAWHEAHGTQPIEASALAGTVRELIAPMGNRQMIAHQVQQLAGQRVEGYACIALPKPGKWSGQRYVVEFEGVEDSEPAKDDSRIGRATPGDEFFSESGPMLH